MALLQKTFGIGKIVGLAIVYAGELFGTAMIVMPSGQPSISRDLAKTLAHVGAVSLRRHQLERERAKLITELSAKNNELEHYTYPVSHILKAPLLTIRGFLTYLQIDVPAGDTRHIQDDLQRINQATVKMQRMLNEMLELSRIGRMMRPPQRISFEEVAHKAVSLTQGRI